MAFLLSYHPFGDIDRVSQYIISADPSEIDE